MMQITDLTKTFGGKPALDRLSCSLPTGSIYGIVGSNGAGKSTMMRLMAGVYKPDSGQVTLEREPVYGNPKAKAAIAFLPDAPYFLPGADVTRMAGLYRRLFPDFDREGFWRLAEELEFDRRDQIDALSTGRRRQLAAILTLSRRAGVFLFDESFDGLDPVARRLMKRLICQKAAEGATVAVCSHSLRELEDLCDRLALLHKGALVLEGDLDALRGDFFKVRVAFRDPYDGSRFEGIALLDYRQQGSVCTLTARGDREETVARIREMEPLLLEAAPLTLEEVFTLKMAEMGYELREGGDEV